jgi:acetate kinase
MAGLITVTRVLVLNPGSSSLKTSFIEQPGDIALGGGQHDWGHDANQQLDREEDVRAAIEALVSDAGDVDAVGYRIAHGGEPFASATVIDDAVQAQILELDELAPLHNAVAAETIAAGRRQLPDVAHVACFDTAFHAGLPETTRRYPLPAAWYDEYGIRRFGFHGLSVSWAVERASELLGKPLRDLHLVVAHLGSGCSATAVSGGHSIDTTMGMTPFEGLMMGSRSGSIDPGILLYLLRNQGMSADGLAQAIGHHSGLLGVSGRSGSVRDLEDAADSGDQDSTLALEMFVHRAAAGIAGLATDLDRLDGLIFTGGIGEHSHRVRRSICERLQLLGVPVPRDPPDQSDAVLAATRNCAVLRINAREDLVISRQVAELLGGAGSPFP